MELLQELRVLQTSVKFQHEATNDGRQLGDNGEPETERLKELIVHEWKRSFFCFLSINCSSPVLTKTINKYILKSFFRISHRLAENGVAPPYDLRRPLGDGRSHRPLQDHEGHGGSGLGRRLAHAVPEGDHQGEQLLLPGGGGSRGWRGRLRVSSSAGSQSENKEKDKYSVTQRTESF